MGSRAADVAVIVPVLGRPQNVAPLVESFLSADNAATLELWFICSPHDTAQIEACARIAAPAAGIGLRIIDWPIGLRGDFARKTNLGLWVTDTEFVFCGADDLRFHDGWADWAISAAELGGAGFVGTNDLANPKVMKGEHTTHPLVRREYALECGTIDTPGLIYTELYHHQWVDTEAVATAKSRGCWAFAADSVVEHRHPIWGTAENDATYELGQSHTAEDRALFTSRRPLWGGGR